MTILLGLTCDEGIVLASDTQGTVDNFSLPTDKITEVRFLSDKALAAKAGDCFLANRVVEIIQEKALSTQLNHPRQMAILAEAAIRQIRDQLVDDDQKKYLEENPFQLMLAQCGPLEPIIYVASSLGVTNKVDTFYATAGCGAVLAECLLHEFLLQPKTIGEAVAVAVYIVDKVKRYDALCGGPTKVKVAPRIGNDGGPCKVYEWPQDIVDNMESEFAISEKTEKPKRMEILSSVLKTVGTRWYEKLKSDSTPAA